MQITLCQFERIDTAMSELLRMGEFETCADPRGYVRTVNKLFGYCVDATSFEFANDFACGLECAAHIVTQALLCQIAVVDREAA